MRYRADPRRSRPLSGKLTSHAAVGRMSSTRADQEIEDVWLGCVYAWLCTSATVKGLAHGRDCWAAGQIGNRPTPVNGCPEDPRTGTRGRPGSAAGWPQLCDRFRMDIDESYLAAAQVFADLVSQVPDQMWENPGLGVWSLRELVGHTSTAALSGVLTTLDKPAQTIVIASPEAYYAIGRTLDPSVYAAAVAAATASASTHAEALGIDPAFAVRALVKDVTIRLHTADGEQLV